jgi:hypothetical protein
VSAATLTQPRPITRATLPRDVEIATSLGAWQVALDRIELDVVRLERHFDTSRELRTDVWDVPQGHGPLPAELRERAAELHARQLRCLERLAASLGTTHRQQVMADAVTRVAPGSHGLPMYVDVVA